MSSSHEGLSITEREEKIAFIIEKRRARGMRVDIEGLRKLPDRQILGAYYDEINYDSRKTKERDLNNPDEFCKAILEDGLYIANITSSAPMTDAEKWEQMQIENQYMQQWARDWAATHNLKRKR